MSDTISFQYDRKKLERLAAQHGFDTVQDYLESLIEEDDEVDVMSDLRVAFSQARSEKLLSEEEFYRSLDEDDDGEN